MNTSVAHQPAHSSNPKTFLLWCQKRDLLLSGLTSRTELLFKFGCLRETKMNTASWNKFATCPICKARFKIGRLNRHIKIHPGITPEGELLIRNAVIASLRKSYIEEQLESDLRITQQKNISATNVLMSRKQQYHSSKTVSGGSFGQGKKK
ncbi:hypothetical protein [Klebsiella aerogenes]|uniref:hypothetical protein n=2 Tax=Klebsiella aerogenes TaxID=548 RepID=UPI0015C8E3A5|nr:hypothetical protein [Klebsiella aerogenes]EMA4693177.1 hypothetical protein [Klebsiella aerogenes]WVJ32663.1 hypothetical protein V1231_10475 [Klebsiella aerogenes]